MERMKIPLKRAPRTQPHTHTRVHTATKRADNESGQRERNGASQCSWKVQDHGAFPSKVDSSISSYFIHVAAYWENLAGMPIVTPRAPVVLFHVIRDLM